MVYMPTGPQPVKTKPLATETADVHSLLHARVDGNGHHNGHHNGHYNGHHNGRGRRRRPQIRSGVRLAAAHAESGLLLVRQHAFPVAKAALWTGSNPAAIAAMGILHDYGDIELLAAVKAGEVPFLPTAERIKPLVEADKAFDALSNLDRIEWARRRNPEQLFDDVIAPAMEPAPINLVVEF